MSKNSVSIVLVHSNGLFRDGVVSLLKQDGRYSVTEIQNLEMLEHTISGGFAFDAMLIEASVIGQDTNGCISRLRSLQPSCRIVLLAEKSNNEVYAQALSGGADGLFLKAICGEALLGFLRLIMLGEKVFPPMYPALLTHEKNGSPLEPENSQSAEMVFSERESDVLRCLVNGESNKRIALNLNIAEATVKIHLRSILRKTRVSNRTQAAIWAIQRGIAKVVGVGLAVLAELELVEIDGVPAAYTFIYATMSSV